MHSVEKDFPPYGFLQFLLVCHTYMFQIIKKKNLEKVNASEHKMQFYNDHFIH